MNPIKYLANRLERTMHGPMWHGPAVFEVLNEFTAAQAAQHPIPGAHSAWELVRHLTAWAEIAAVRLDGEAQAYPPADVDWPAVPSALTDDAWRADVERLAAVHAALAARARTLAPERLLEIVPGQEHTVSIMLDGVVEHAVYHGGQLALLRRALHPDQRR